MRKHGVYVAGAYVCQGPDGRITKEYSAWSGMLERCFDPKFKVKWPTYADCTCSYAFLDFQEFATWMTSQVGFSKDCHLDKDLLVRGNKAYRPELCLLLPHAVNTLLIHKRFPNRCLPTGVTYVADRGKYVAQINRRGRYDTLGRFESVPAAEAAYKRAKEEEIRRVANLHKDVLDPRAYTSLMDYQV